MTTPDLKLLIGPKNRSTWSLRAWIILSHYGIPFAEDHIDYNTPSGYKRLQEISPAGWVPVLWHNGEPVWDTLSIAEYLAETFPEYEMWPTDKRARAVARSVVAEMHSGFTGLRSEMPMLASQTGLSIAPSQQCRNDILRIQTIWDMAREEHGAGGPFLFGKFSIADAFYAPVVSRFHTYGVVCEGAGAEWAAMMLELPSMQTWIKGAQAEVMEGR